MSKVHYAIPATTFGGTRGKRLHGMVLAMFFGGEMLAWCRRDGGAWFATCLLESRESQLHRVTCLKCLEHLYRVGLRMREGYTMPLFDR